jgi:hypothetical protein
MSIDEKRYQLILGLLKERSCAKQSVYKTSKGHFDRFKVILNEFAAKLEKDAAKMDQKIDIHYREVNDFEVELKFAGDVLLFCFHTNIFNFDDSHEVKKLPYVKEDPMRAYCGVIQVYNFLGDTVKYNRQMDMGYMVGRIFINKENSFFVEGKRQLGFLFNDFGKAKMNDVYIKHIVEAAVAYAIDFDLLTPPFEQVNAISYQEKQYHTMNAGMKTGKRLGFQFNMDNDEMKG